MCLEHDRIHLETSSVLIRELPLSLLRRPPQVMISCFLFCWLYRHFSLNLRMHLSFLDRIAEVQSHNKSLEHTVSSVASIEINLSEVWSAVLLPCSGPTMLTIHHQMHSKRYDSCSVVFSDGSTCWTIRLCWQNPVSEFISVPADDVTIGKPLSFPSYGWDNEYGQRQFHVQSFAASNMLTSNGLFLEFVKDNGYHKHEFWTANGWKWRSFRNAKWPGFWVPDGPAGLHKYKVQRFVFRDCLSLILPHDRCIIVLNVCSWDKYLKK